MIKPKAKKPHKEIGVKEVVDEEKLQLSTISQHLSEKSEVKPRISKSDEPMVRTKTTIKMTPSSQKSMVAQSLEKGTENKSEVQNTTISFESGAETLSSETNIAMTPSSQKSMVAQFLEKETETYNQNSVGTESETIIETIEMTPSSRKSMVSQFSEKGTGNESGVYDTKVSVANDLGTNISSVVEF